MLFNIRFQELNENKYGYTYWKYCYNQLNYEANNVTLLICDMWDKHWCKPAQLRTNRLASKMNSLVNFMRSKGVKIIHSPSNVIDYYKNSNARLSIINIPKVQLPKEIKHINPPIPIDDFSSISQSKQPLENVWTRQHKAIQINNDLDVISDDGIEIYRFIYHYNIQLVLVMGIHTNLCVLNRSFGIKQLVKWGINTVLIRDMTDSLNNPEKTPYVNHNQGRKLIISYIEKYWCPSIIGNEYLK